MCVKGYSYNCCKKPIVVIFPKLKCKSSENPGDPDPPGI